jgi:hypothetical protein
MILLASDVQYCPHHEHDNTGTPSIHRMAAS